VFDSGFNPRKVINQIEKGIEMDLDMDGDIGVDGGGVESKLSLFVVVHDTELGECSITLQLLVFLWAHFERLLARDCLTWSALT